MKGLLLMVLSVVACTRSFKNRHQHLVSSTKFALKLQRASAFTMSTSSTNSNNSNMNSGRSIDAIAVPDNSFHKYLKREDAPLVDGSKIHSRQVKGVHYSCVLPEKVKNPYLIAVSTPCMDGLEIAPSEAQSPDFVQYFSGNKLIPGMEEPYTTVYGTHSAGQWFGQMGDGRAVYLGETHVSQTDTQEWERKTHNEPSTTSPFYSLGLRELQLKGSGRSPFSRGFDGRAVLRSSVREFLVSEAMFHLGVPTTRALSLIGTSQAVRRPWYAATSTQNPYRITSADRKFPPDTMVVEPGAIVCRVARSFLRFGHLEIFGHRQEYPELLQMADYVCLREYPHLLAMPLPTDSLPDQLSAPGNTGNLRRYVELFRCIMDRVAYLVSQWLRVGYVQGNMNSDNTLLAGRTMDYGPFGWMEAFDPYYQPFTSDGYGNFCFIRQPVAMGVNLETLRESAIEPLLKYVDSLRAQSSSSTEETAAGNEEMMTLLQAYEEVRRISSDEYTQRFTQYYQDVQRQKLGLSQFLASDETLWTELLKVMTSSSCDYTIFFRELSKVDAQDINNVPLALQKVAPAFATEDNEEKQKYDEKAWNAWMTRYLTRLQENDYDADARRSVMNAANPKFVLRNWMGTMAYEKAEEGDYSLIEELQSLLQQPYAEQSSAVTAKYYQRTPTWAKQLPGVTFFSCSS